MKIYETDGHCRQFDTEVLACTQAEGGYELVLGATAFFPEGGGQASDEGTLNGQKVLALREVNHGTAVSHLVAQAMEPGTRIHGELDWTIRFPRMQNHSAEHLISGIVHRDFGYDNVGFHMGREAITLDFNGMLTKEDLMEVERQANEAVYQNLPVEISFPDKDELSKLAYRSKKELDGVIRIVTIPGIDCCACCAPHVSRTGEIGCVKILDVQKYKSGVRVTMLAGTDAMHEIDRRSALVQQLAVQFSVKPDQVEEAVDRLRLEAQLLKEQRSTLIHQMYEWKSDAIEREQREQKDAADPICFEEQGSMDEIRFLVNRLVEKTGRTSAVFSLSDIGETNLDRYQFVIGSKSEDLRLATLDMRKQLQARGGGSQEMIQGSLQCQRSRIEQWWKNRRNNHEEAG